jgi:hypothetical protein
MFGFTCEFTVFVELKEWLEFEGFVCLQIQKEPQRTSCTTQKLLVEIEPGILNLQPQTT